MVLAGDIVLGLQNVVLQNYRDAFGAFDTFSSPGLDLVAKSNFFAGARVRIQNSVVILRESLASTAGSLQ